MNAKPSLTLVDSSKLLRRLEAKRIIGQPDVSAEQLLPSLRGWGGKRGYCHVTPLRQCSEFSFEGSDYTTVTIGGRFYIYRIASEHRYKHDK